MQKKIKIKTPMGIKKIKIKDKRFKGFIDFDELQKIEMDRDIFYFRQNTLNESLKNGGF